MVARIKDWLIGAAIAGAILTAGITTAWSPWSDGSVERGPEVAATPIITSEPQPIETAPPRLTATEAEVFAKRYLDQGYENSSRPVDERISVDCGAREYNEVTGEWLVACFASAGPGMGFELVLAINAQNGEVRFP
jgi:hypothetical protein